MCSDQPDLRQVIADAINELMRTQDFQPGQPQEQVARRQITVLRQRVIQRVETLNTRLNGGDLAASVALTRQGELDYPWLFVTCRPPGKEQWRPFGSVSGEGRLRDDIFFLGKSIAQRSFICIGSINVVPDGGSIRIESPDGALHEGRSVDGCCLVLAPVMFPPDIGEPVTVRYLYPDGGEINSETI